MVDVKGGKIYTKRKYHPNIDISSQVDGIIDTFTVPDSKIFVSGHLTAKLNGIDQMVGLAGSGEAVEEVGTTQLKFAVVPLSGDNIFIAYLEK